MWEERSSYPVSCIRGYRWFALAEDGDLQPVSSDLPSYDANLVALPRERVEEFSAMASAAS